MESEYWEKNPFKAIAKVFPPEFHFKPTTINKTKTFYEFILIDSNSVSIKHFKDPKEPLLNTHSTIQILKVLQPRQFGSNLNEIKKISIPFDPRGYTYWDYMDTNTVYNFSNWFLQWRYFFGPIPKIFPEQHDEFVKWWNQFDTSKAQPDKVKIRFKAHLEFLKAPDPETSLFLNQKSQLAAFLATSNSKEHLMKKLKEVLQLLQSQLFWYLFE
ncbi:hypothetical protein JHK85_043735 [Glycine max]|nr:hypothetical protein JHK85_043735 [Glycine max]